MWINKKIMNEKIILDLVEKGESETLEFKRNFDKDAIEAITAFANTKGGIILVGSGLGDRLECH